MPPATRKVMTRIAALHVDLRQQRRQVALGLQLGDALEEGLERLDAPLLHGFLIHARGEVVADLLLRLVAPGSLGRHLVQDAPEVAQVVLAQLGVDAP
jgi:hypothetical protein